MRFWSVLGNPIDEAAGAYASFSNMTGSLTPGKRFDAVIWDDDLMTVPQEEILEVEVKGTVVDGRLAYGVLKG